MSVKSYMVETMKAFAVKDAYSYDELHVIVLGRYMGDGEKLQDCLMALCELGLLSNAQPLADDGGVWQITDSGIDAVHRLMSTPAA